MIYQATILTPKKSIVFVFEATDDESARNRAAKRAKERDGLLVELRQAGQAQAAAFATIKASATFPMEAMS